jgi:Tol biopolymer transport system component
MKNHCIKLVALVSLVVVAACSQNAPKELLENLVQQQQKNRLAIGWVDDQKLNVILFSLTKPEIRSYTLPGNGKRSLPAHEDQNAAGKVDGTDVSWSPDGKWVTYRTRENKFVLADASGKTQRVLFDGQQVGTPLHWSPDDDFLMYVKKAATWEPINPMKCLDDAEDVMVYRVQDGQQGRVYQVCAGYPYWELHWLKVPANLPL